MQTNGRILTRVDDEIKDLTEFYQRQLADLSTTHTQVEVDMQRLAQMLGPYMTPSGKIVVDKDKEIDPKVVLFKQGLDFRLAEYMENCKRLQTTQMKLQRKLEEAASAYEATFFGASGLADARIIRRMEEQKRLIQAQQRELDQMRFERDVLADESRRMRTLYVRGPVELPRYSGSNVTVDSIRRNLVPIQEIEDARPPGLHALTQAVHIPPVGGDVKHASMDTAVGLAQAQSTPLTLPPINQAAAQPNMTGYIANGRSAPVDGTAKRGGEPSGGSAAQQQATAAAAPAADQAGWLGWLWGQESANPAPLSKDASGTSNAPAPKPATSNSFF